MKRIEFVTKTFLEVGDELFDPATVTEPDRIAETLATPRTVWGLASSGYAEETMQLVRKLSPDQQVAVLAAPEAFPALTDNRQAKNIMALLQALTPDQQTSVLTAPNAALSLAITGHAARLIKALAPKQQQSIIFRPRVKRELIHMGHGKAVTEILDNIDRSWKDAERPPPPAGQPPVLGLF